MGAARSLAFVIGGTILGCPPLHAETFPFPLPNMTSALPEGASAAPPPGFVALCMHVPAQCAKAERNAPARVTLNERTRDELAAVNREINIAITYESDEQQYSVANVWSPNAIGGRGDCKDYALAKRELLIGEGFPEKALRLAVLRTPQDELHAVLTVVTDHGDLVLDSATTEIKPWWQTGYRWLERQSADDPLRWVELAPGARLVGVLAPQDRHGPDQDQDVERQAAIGGVP